MTEPLRARDRFPGKTWETRTPQQVGLKPGPLEALANLTTGRGCIVRNGYLVFSWGDIARPGEVASATKPMISTLLLLAVQERRLASVDAEVAASEPRLRSLNGGKDAPMRWRHLASQTSGYGLAEAPGAAWAYNDYALALYYDTLFGKVYGRRADDVLHEKISEPLGFEDASTFEAFGPRDRPGRLGISPRDFARFGWMVLRGGVWGRRRIVRRDLLKMSLESPVPSETPRTSGKEAPMLLGQRTLGGGKNQTGTGPGLYSFNWWINGRDREGRRLFADAPPKTVAASGHGGIHMLWIVPEWDLILSWNDVPFEDQDDSPTNPQTGPNRAARLLRAAVGGD